MNPRDLAALLSSLISQALLLLLLLFPSPNPFSIPSSFSSPPHDFLLPFLHHFFFTSEIAASLTLLPFSRKRKRTHVQSCDLSEDDDVSDPPAFGPGSLERVIPKNPDAFKHFFRMNSSTFEWICGLLEPLLECRDPAGSPLNLPAETRLGIGLFRLATGSDYPEISTRFRVSELVSKFCVKQLCRVLCTNYRFWVGFPSENDISFVSNQFETLNGLPNCCGIIDCTRFKIIRNQGPDDIIAAQIVVDAMSRILSIAVGFRGNKSNFEVLKLSTLYRDIQNGNLLNSRTIYSNDQDIPQYLVGVQQYPLLPWLMVPFVDPLEGSRDSNFNNVLKSMCLSMSKAIRSLKSWGVLSSPISADFKTAIAYVGSCSILHNMLLSREDFSAFCNDVSDSTLHVEGFHSSLEEITDEKATAVRNALAARV